MEQDDLEGAMSLPNVEALYIFEEQVDINNNTENEGDDEILIGIKSKDNTSDQGLDLTEKDGSLESGNTGTINGSQEGKNKKLIKNDGTLINPEKEGDKKSRKKRNKEEQEIINQPNNCDKCYKEDKLHKDKICVGCDLC